MFSRFHEWLRDVGWFVFLSFAGASVVWNWWIWFRLPLKFPPSKLGSWSGFVALVAGTMSVSLVALLVLLPAVGETLPITWSYVGWGTAGVALALSPFGRGRLRIAGVMIGIIMCSLWWDLWMISHFRPFSLYQ